MKKIVAALLCGVLAFSGTAYAGAAEQPEKYEGFEEVQERVSILDNTVTVFAYGIDENNSGGIRYVGGNSETKYEIMFKDCISSPKAMMLPSNQSYARYFTSGAGNAKPYHSFANTGGEYKKIRIKLSEFSDYFNEDGSYTGSWFDISHDFKFKYEKISDNEIYNSNLAFISGGAVTAVTPNENGEVEIYVSTNVGANVEFITSYTWTVNNSIGGGGGVSGKVISNLKFGNVNGDSFVNVDDVTYLQMYLAGMVELDTLQLFHADTNCDGVYDVADVTQLQFGIAGL